MEQMELLEKKSHTSFGKLILADEKNEPLYSKNSIIQVFLAQKDSRN
jgi:hypothetical protein